MLSLFKNELRDLCDRLNKHSIDYLLIGGYAVNYHGFLRATGDIDIWYRPSVETYLKLIDVIKDLGFDTIDLEHNIFDSKRSFIHLPFPHFYIEFLPTINGNFKFSEVHANSVKDTIDDVPIRIINYDDLIENKISTRRPKDFQDIEELSKRKDAKKKQQSQKGKGPSM